MIKLSLIKQSQSTTSSTTTKPGFTIVELLVVIVVIGILAAITIISYTGVSQRAIGASLQSDLASAKKQLQIYQTDHDAYPVEIDDCPTPAVGNLCISQSSGGNDFSDYSVNNTTNPPTFTLDAFNGDVTYRVTESTVPVAFTSTPTPATQGPLSPGTVVDDSTVGQVAWVSPDNTKVSDDAYATATNDASQHYTHYLKATNFGFSIPAGSTIDGILIQVERKAIGDFYFNYSRLVKTDGSLSSDGRVDGGNHLFPAFDTYTSVPSFGGQSDLWGETWTPADINNSNFGFVFFCLAQPNSIGYIDHIRMTVYYTTP